MKAIYSLEIRPDHKYYKLKYYVGMIELTFDGEFDKRAALKALYEDRKYLDTERAWTVKKWGIPAFEDRKQEDYHERFVNACISLLKKHKIPVVKSWDHIARVTQSHKEGRLSLNKIRVYPAHPPKNERKNKDGKGKR